MKFSKAINLLNDGWGSIYRKDTKERLIKENRGIVYLNDYTSETDSMPLKSINAEDWRAARVTSNTGEDITISISAGFKSTSIKGEQLKEVWINTERYTVGSTLIDVSKFIVDFHSIIDTPYNEWEEWLKAEIPIKIRARIHSDKYRCEEQVINLYTVEDLEKAFPQKDRLSFVCSSTVELNNGEEVF